MEAMLNSALRLFLACIAIIDQFSFVRKTTGSFILPVHEEDP